MQHVVKFVQNGSLTEEYREHVLTVCHVIDSYDPDNATICNHIGWSANCSSKAKNLLAEKNKTDFIILELAKCAKRHKPQLRNMGVAVESLEPVFKPGRGYEEWLI